MFYEAESWFYGKKIIWTWEQNKSVFPPSARAVEDKKED